MPPGDPAVPDRFIPWEDLLAKPNTKENWTNSSPGYRLPGGPE
jgi:hypothetical protein